MYQPPTIMKHDIVLAVEIAVKYYKKYAQKKIKMIYEDLTLEQAYIIQMLHEDPKLTQVDIADSMGKDYAALSRMVDSLESKDYLKRVKHAADKRKSKLKLRPKAEEALQIIVPAMEHNQQQAFKGISQEEIDELNRILSKVAINCQELL